MAAAGLPGTRGTVIGPIEHSQDHGVNRRCYVENRHELLDDDFMHAVPSFPAARPSGDRVGYAGHVPRCTSWITFGWRQLHVNTKWLVVSCGTS